MIKKLVLSNNGYENDVSEILHKGIIVLFEKVLNPDFRLTSELSTYLYSICRNEFNNYKRRFNREQNLDDLNNDFPADMVENEDEELNERSQQIVSMLNMAGETCKKLLNLYYTEKLKFQEIAKRMNYTNAANAKNQKYKCLKKIRKLTENE